MNRFIIAAAFAAVALTAAAKATIPEYFSEDWSEPLTQSGWTPYGSGKTPSGGTAEIIGTDSWSLVEFPSGKTYMTSTSTTKEGGKANARLVSPAISVPSTGAVLSMDLAVWNPDKTVDNKISIYAVPDGEEEDYSDYDALYSRRVPANDYFSPLHVGLPLQGLEGKTVRIVIVNEGNDCGLLGIGETRVAMYDAEIRDLSPLYLRADGKWKPNVSVASAACFGRYTATLKVGDTVVETLSVEVDPESGYVSYPIEFAASIEAVGTEGPASHHYEITLTPDAAEAPGITARGSVVFGGGYPGVVVEEEGTGEQCGNCPYGAAGLARFSDLYPDRFFGIAIHCTDQFSTDVMRAPDYALQFEKNPRNPIVSLPSALINRSQEVTPSNLSETEKTVEKYLGMESPVKIEIARVDHDEATAGMKVAYTLTSCADLSGADLSVAAVLTADGLKGTGHDWTQTNYLSGRPRPSEIDDAWWEYVRFYFEYPSKYISSTDYQFDHVAMGIYPGFDGKPMEAASEMSAGVGVADEIPFTMPMQTAPNGFGVQDPANTAVTLLVMDRRTGAILTAARAEAADYNKELSAVEDILSDAGQEATARFYDLSGRQVDPLRCESGIYVRVQGTRTHKIIIRN